MAYINAALLRAVFEVQALARRLRDEAGQDTMEWAMLSGLVALAIIGITIALSGALDSLITGIGNCIDFNSNGVTECLPGGIF